MLKAIAYRDSLALLRPKKPRDFFIYDNKVAMALTIDQRIDLRGTCVSWSYAADITSYDRKMALAVEYLKELEDKYLH